jgi:hypothetical protein
VTPALEGAGPFGAATTDVQFTGGGSGQGGRRQPLHEPAGAARAVEEQDYPAQSVYQLRRMTFAP